jgi:Periplasmic copper-binding protein (NosD)
MPLKLPNASAGYSQNTHQQTLGLIEGADRQNVKKQGLATAVAMLPGNAFANIAWPPYNAVGDNATDNAAAFAAAVADVNAAGGGEIRIPPGAFYTTQPVTDGTTMVRFVGAGPSDFKIGGMNIGGSKGSCVTVGTNNVSAFTLSNRRSSVEGLLILGCNSLSATANAVNLNGVEDVIRDCRIAFGYYGLNGGNDGLAEDVGISAVYGPALANYAGNMRRLKLDQSNWSASFGATFSAWAAATPVTAGTLVTLGGWYIRCTTTGTTGGSAPTLQPYQVNMPDNTAVWTLAFPTTYSGLIVGATSTVDDCDFSGPYSAAVVVTGGSVYFQNCAFAALQTGIWTSSTAANDLKVVGSRFNPFISSSSVAILIDTAWKGDVIIDGCTILGCANGVQVKGGTNTCIIGNMIFPSGTGISVAAGITDFTIFSNFFNSATWGACSTAVTIATGASDRYTVANNKVHGCTTGVSDGGTGTNKNVSSNF